MLKPIAAILHLLDICHRKGNKNALNPNETQMCCDVKCTS
jgi:hypothetical protein